MTELKPCPFCGGTPDLHNGNVPGGRTFIAWVECHSKNCFGPVTSNYDSSDDAVAAWNRRALPSEGPVAWIEPTPEMLKAFDVGFKAQINLRHKHRFDAKAPKRADMSAEEAGLRAMLAAAPSPIPHPESEGEKS